MEDVVLQHQRLADHGAEVSGQEASQVALADTARAVQGHHQGLVVDVGGQVVLQVGQQTLHCPLLPKHLPPQRLLQPLQVVPEDVVI